jgi:F-type H+-transporting ATPase subunit epsilon
VEVENNVMTVLVETAEPADQIDVGRAKAALARAEEALKKLTNEDKDFKIMEAALERAVIRVQVAGKTVH